MNDNKDLYEQVNAEIDLVTDKPIIETTKPPKYSIVSSQKVTNHVFPCVLIRDGEYAGVKVRYGKVWGPNQKIAKSNEKVPENQIRFQYEIVEDKNGKTTGKKDEPQLMSVLGSVLTDLLINTQIKPKSKKQTETQKKTYKERKIKSR